MAGKVVETVSLKLDLQGFAQLQGLGNKFKKLENPIKLAGTGVTRLKNEILGLGKAVPNTISHLSAQADALTRVRQTTEIGTQEFRELTIEINRVNAAINQANASMNKASFGRKDMFQGLGIVGGAMAFGGPLPGATGLIGGGINKAMGGSFKEGATAGVGVGFAAKPMVEAIGDTAVYASSIEKAKIALKGITKDQKSYEIALAAAQKATSDYNVPQEVAIRGMTRLSAAVLGAGGNIHNATEAFLNTTVAIKGTAGSADDVKSAITAMVQIFSKGKVSAEELSGQLGERFPAAVTKFAKANDISTQKLQKNLKDGTVGLDMLSKFITSLGEEYEPLARKIAASNEEAGARSQIAMNRLKIAVGTVLKDIGAEFQEVGANLAVDLIPALKDLAKLALQISKAIIPVIKLVANNFEFLTDAVIITGAAFLGLKIQALVAGFGALVIKLKAATIWQTKFNIVASINPYVAVTAGIAALLIMLNKLQRKWSETKAQMMESLFGLSVEEAGKEWLKNLEEIEKKQKAVALASAFGQKAVEEILQEIAYLERRNEVIKDYIAKQNELNDINKKKKFDPADQDESGDVSPLEKFAADAFDYAAQIETAVVSAFGKMEDAIVKFAQTGKLEFKDLVSSILADMLKIAIRATITAPLMKAMGFAIPGLADGGVIAGNNIVPYRKGGVVNSPTMFQYGGSKLGIMGEAGPEAILPLKRGSSGKLGVEMHGGGGARATTGNYTGPTLNFNGDEYVPRSAVGGIINAAAKQGASMGETATIRSLQNNRSSRSRIGMR